MARKRMLDPGIWDSEQVMKLSPAQFKLYVYLISQADDEGRVKSTPAMMRSRVHPVTEYPLEKFIEDLDDVVASRLVVRYGEGGQYIAHPKWKMYQKIDRPTKSLIPAPPSDEPKPEAATPAPVEDPRRVLDEPSSSAPDAPEEPVEVKGPDAATLGAREVIEYLNEKAKRSFKVGVDATLRHARARLNDGFTVADLKRVVDSKVKEWGSSEKWRKYLRPSTLFAPEKFDGYLQDATPLKLAAKKAADEKVLHCPQCHRVIHGAGCFECGVSREEGVYE